MPLLTKEEHGTLIEQRLREGTSLRALSRELLVNRDTVTRFVRREFPDMISLAGHPAPVEEEYIPHFNILTIDIETRPNLAYIWGVWDQNIQPNMIIDEKEVISFAAKWYDQEEVIFYSVHHQGKDEMIKAAYELLDQADAVIGYNSKSFDVPHLNREFLMCGMTPPSPFRQIDLLQTMRRKFKFTHNKLDHIANKLGIGSKVEHEGFDLWKKCMAGEPDAWARMMEYNCNDVLLTEKLYDIVKPWIDNHPSYAAIHGDTRCTNCGSAELRSKGWTHTKTGRYRRYICKSCGTYVRDTHVTARAPITATAAW